MMMVMVVVMVMVMVMVGLANVIHPEMEYVN